jgi:hypothetical protein
MEVRLSIFCSLHWAQISGQLHALAILAPLLYRRVDVVHRSADTAAFDM